MERNVTESTHLSKKDVRRIRQYVSYLLTVMRLPEWTILIDEKASEENETTGAWASIRPTDGRLVAILDVTTMWGTDDLDNTIRTHVLIHEMAHLYHRDTWDHLQDLFWDGGFVPSHTATTVQEIIRQDHEKQTDRIADMLEALVKPYPLKKDAVVNPRVRMKGKGA